MGFDGAGDVIAALTGRQLRSSPTTGGRSGTDAGMVDGMQS